MIQLYRDNRIFFNLTFLFIIVGAIILALTEKGDVEIFVNQRGNLFLDYFFYYITYLGDGIVIILILVGLLFYRVYYALIGGFIFLISSIISQALKRLVFHDYPRPFKFFDPEIGLKYIDGLDIHSWYSFPSGHSSGAFTIMLFLTLIAKNKTLEFIFFMLALLAAFSRVYLLQHFFMDIYGGAVLGIMITAILYYLIQYKTNLPSNTRLNQPLSELLKKDN